MNVFVYSQQDCVILGEFGPISSKCGVLCIVNSRVEVFVYVVHKLEFENTSPFSFLLELSLILSDNFQASFHEEIVYFSLLSFHSSIFPLGDLVPNMCQAQGIYIQ